MMSPIVSALDRVELVQYSYQIEYACALRFLDKMDSDGAEALIRLFSDLQLYNVMMSRETNFRWSDISGVRSSSSRWRYVRRLFQSGDGSVIPRIKQEQPILHLVTHMLLGIGACLFEALGERLRFVEVVRHPLYMIKQQFKYMDRWGADVRDFSIWLKRGDRDVPWFAWGWEEKFVQANAMDRAIFMTEASLGRQETVMGELSDEARDRLLIIPFERFVVDPWPYMKRLENLLGTKMTRVTRRELKKQNIPRKMYAEGIGRPIYKEYGWEPPVAGGDEESEFSRRRQFAAETATPEGMAVLDRLCYEYEQKYLAVAG